MKKSLKYIISFIFILVCYTNVYSQISIDVLPPFSKNYSIKIDYDDDYYFLTLKVRDSVFDTEKQQKELDLLFQKYYVDLLKHSDSLNHIIKAEVEVAMDKYAEYSIQKIIVLKKVEQEYNQIINQVINSSEEDLTNQKTGNRYVMLGGTSCHITIKHNEEIKVLSAKLTERAPEIYNFIMATRNLFVERGVFPPS